MALQHFDGAFELDSAGAFDEDDVAGLKVFRKPFAGGLRVGQKDGSNSAKAGGSGKMLCIARTPDNQIDAGFRSCFAAGGMKHGGVFTELEHLASDKDPALRGASRKRMNHGKQCFGVGIVAVVEDGGARDLEDFSALAAGRELLDCGNGGLAIDSGFERDRKPCDGVLRVVRAEKMQIERALMLACAITHMQSRYIFLHFENCRIAAGPDAEIDDLPRKVAAELRDVGDQSS